MPYRKALINLSVFCVTWLVVRRFVFNDATFDTGDAVAMLVAGAATFLTTQWMEGRRARSAS